MRMPGPHRWPARPFDLGGQVVRTISAFMRFDTAVKITTSQLRIELMFPADDVAEAYFQSRRLP